MALGALTAGIIQDGTQYAGNLGPCAFPFNVSGVPGGKGLYRVAVSHRETVDYIETDLRKRIDLKV